MAAGSADTDPSRVVRSTRQRRAIEELMASSDDFRSAQDVHELLRRAGERVGLATVYRALQAMVDSGELDVLKTGAGEAVYRRCGASHHHHLVCRQCGRTVEIKGPTVERWATTVAEKHGYDDVRHTLELFGVCTPCQERSGQERSGQEKDRA
jgi:Fur family ferric uptake transcriptional regulator